MKSEFIISSNHPDQRYNFDIQPNARLFTPYDYYSIMHYGEFEFSANGQRTIQAKVGAKALKT